MRLMMVATPALRGRESGTSLSFIASFNVTWRNRRDYPPEHSPCQAEIEAGCVPDVSGSLLPLTPAPLSLATASRGERTGFRFARTPPFARAGEAVDWVRAIR